MREDEIRTLCELARLELPTERRARVGAGIDQMLEYFQILESFQSEANETSEPPPVANRLREDVPTRSFPGVELVGQAPAEKRDFFLVPNVL